MKNVEELTGRIDSSTIKKYSEVKQGFTKFIDGDILLAKITPCMENGKFAICNGLKNGIGFGSTEFHVIRLHLDLSREYFFQFLLQERFRNEAAAKMTGTAGQKRVPVSFLRDTELPLPPLGEQCRIVSRIEQLFTQLDEGVRSLQQAQTQLEQYKQATLQSAFEGKLTSDYENSVDIVYALPNMFNISEYTTLNTPELPEYWGWIVVGAFTDSLKNGLYKPAEYYADTGTPCLRMYNIEDWKIVWKDIKRMNLTSKEVFDYQLLAGDILVNRVNSRELVGKSAVIPEGMETSVFESKNIRLRVKKEFLESRYVNYWFRYFAQRYFNINAQQTVGMASINQEQLTDMPVPYPPLEEQKLIAERLDEIFSQSYSLIVDILSAKNRINILKQGILKLAFEGKLVPQDPTDEPASVLLERIQTTKGSAKMYRIQRRLD